MKEKNKKTFWYWTNLSKTNKKFSEKKKKESAPVIENNPKGKYQQ